MGTQLPSPKRGRAPQLSAHLYCGQTAGCIKVPLGMEVGLSLGDSVRWGPSSPPPKGHSPQFSAHVCCGQTAGCDIVLDGTQLRFTKKGHSSQLHFSAHVYCGQTVRWIKTPRGMEVGLGPGHIVLDGYPASPKWGHSPPIFGPRLLWPNGWTYQDANWYGDRPWPGDIVLDGGPSSA